MENSKNEKKYAKFFKNLQKNMQKHEKKHTMVIFQKKSMKKMKNNASCFTEVYSSAIHENLKCNCAIMSSI